MLSLERCRELLGQPELSDAEVERIRAFLYGLGELLIEDYRAGKEGRPLDLP